MRRATIGVLILIVFLGVAVSSVVASDLEMLWMSSTPEGLAQTDFPSGTETVYVMFEYTDFVLENVRVVVSDYKGTNIFQATQMFSGSGIASIPVTYGQSAFPDGPYVTTLYFAGQYLTRAVEWTVGGSDSPPMPTAFPPPHLEVDPAALTFSTVQGGSSPSAQRVLVSNDTASASVWWARADVPWLQLTPVGGETPALLRVSVDGTGLPAGTYTGHVTVEADGIGGSPQTVDVRFDVLPPDGTTTLNLPAIAEGAGWVVSDEASGNHFGEGDIQVGVRAGQEYLGGLQFNLSEIPDGSNIQAAAVILPGLGWETQPPGGDWVLELIDEDLVEGWANRGYAEVASATSRVTLIPNYSVNDLGAGSESVWHLDTPGLDVLESLAREGDFAVLRLRYEPALAQSPDHNTDIDDALFVWDATGVFRVNFEPGAGPIQTATPATNVTETPSADTPTPTVATPVQTITVGPSATPTATPAVPPPPPGGRQPLGAPVPALAWMLAMLGVLGMIVQRFVRLE